MKKSILIIMSLVLTSVMLTSCYKDMIHPGADPNGPPQQVTFSGDIIPIFDKSCNSSGCHDAIPSKKPALSPDKAYNALMSGGYVNTIVPDKSSLYQSVKSNSMPISTVLSASEKQKILDWIRLGAPNN
jgi:hypothetical protein